MAEVVLEEMKKIDVAVMMVSCNFEVSQNCLLKSEVPFGHSQIPIYFGKLIV